jgi:hypothetical protein
MLTRSPVRATRDTAKSVIHRSIPPRSRLRRSRGAARAGPHEMFHTCIPDCAGGFRRGRVSLKIRLILSLPMSNPSKGSRNLLSNTLTRLETDYQIHGFFGSTRATQLASSRAIGRLQTKSKSRVGRIPRPISLNSFMTGCGTKRMESGFLSSIISMIIVSFMKLYPQARIEREAARLACQDSRSWHIFPKARMGRSS